MFSVIIAAPSAIEFSAITSGCRSVGEARVGQRDDVDRARPAVHHDAEPVVGALDDRAAGLPACPARSRGARAGPRTVTSPCVIAAANAQVPATMRSGTCRGSSGAEPVDALDGQGRGADAVDLGAHLLQHLAEVDDLRLARRVVDDRGARGEDRGHQDVLGGADAREVQPDRSRRSARAARGRRCSRARCRARRRAWSGRPCGSPAAARADGVAAGHAPPRPRRSARAAARARRSRRASGGPGRSRPGGRARPGRRSRPSRCPGRSRPRSRAGAAARP